MRLANTKHYFNSAMIGMILGDGSMMNDHVLYLRHGNKQFEYLDEKVSFVRNYIKPVTHRESTDKKGYSYKYAYYNTKKLKFLYCLIYPKGKKVITKKLLNRFNEISLAFFYMDDGCLALRKNPINKVIKARSIHLNVQSFTWEEAENFKQMLLSKFGVEFRITTDKGNPRLWSNTENTIKFLEIVAPIVREFHCMHYKLDLKYKKKDISFL